MKSVSDGGGDDAGDDGDAIFLADGIGGQQQRDRRDNAVDPVVGVGPQEGVVQRGVDIIAGPLDGAPQRADAVPEYAHSVGGGVAPGHGVFEGQRFASVPAGVGGIPPDGPVAGDESQPESGGAGHVHVMGKGEGDGYRIAQVIGEVGTGVGGDGGPGDANEAVNQVVGAFGQEGHGVSASTWVPATRRVTPFFSNPS